MFAPKTKWQFLIYVFLFFLMLGLIPVINFGVVITMVSVYFYDTLKVANWLLEYNRGYGHETMKIGFFFLFLPWNLFVIGSVTAISAIPACLALPVMLLPSYFLNVRSYFKIMAYWWSGNRFSNTESAAAGPTDPANPQINPAVPA
jgi:hypothetical protein